MDLPMLQMDAPRREDGRCVIAANRDGLLQLKTAIDTALAGGHARCELCAPDGEALDLHVLQLADIAQLQVHYANEMVAERSLREQFSLDQALQRSQRDLPRRWDDP